MFFKGNKDSSQHPASWAGTAAARLFDMQPGGGPPSSSNSSITRSEESDRSDRSTEWSTSSSSSSSLSADWKSAAFTQLCSKASRRTRPKNTTCQTRKHDQTYQHEASQHLCLFGGEPPRWIYAKHLQNEVSDLCKAGWTNLDDTFQHVQWTPLRPPPSMRLHPRPCSWMTQQGHGNAAILLQCAGLSLKANFAIHNLLICTSRKGEHQGIKYTKTISEQSQSKTHRLRKIMSWCHENVLQSLPLLPNKNREEMGNWLELARANHVETVVNSQASCGILKCRGWPRRSSEPSSPTNGSEPQILWGLKDIQQSNKSIPKKSEKENLSDINSKDSFRNLQPLILFAVFVGPIISDSALNALWVELFVIGLASWASGLMPANARAHAGSKWSHPAPIYQSRGHT